MGTEAMSTDVVSGVTSEQSSRGRDRSGLGTQHSGLAFLRRFGRNRASILAAVFLLLVVLASFGSSLVNIIVTIGLASWMQTARVVRGEVLRASSLEFVTAARALGASAARVLLRHALPQAIPSTIVSASLGVAQAILTE